MILILFGVSGAGKTTVGHLLSSRLGWCFEDSDDLHSVANRRKMESGTPLTDEDREPWLKVLHLRMQEFIKCDRNAVLACSALKQKYRDLLVAGFEPDQVRFALLDAPRALLEERIRKRHHEYMNPCLLDSQLAALEAPADTWRISVRGTEEEAVQQLLGQVKIVTEYGLKPQLRTEQNADNQH
ncbi:MAG: gluconokinase [Candidatus Sulfotelmatobacter sp.]|jgi:gluconokinase